jgi:hypothetical protein
VIVLSSAGYGSFTVTKSLSMRAARLSRRDCADLGSAITVTVDNAVVVLRGLTLNGSLGGSNGIIFSG